MKYKLYEWTQSIQRYKHKKGFTLIELIVVMAIIAILVLLAAPRFLGRTEDALATQIKHDIARAETMVDEYLIRHERLDGWDSAVSIGHLNELVDDGDLYARTGVITGELDPGNYSQVPQDFIERTVNSALEGAFYSDEEGNVYYHQENDGQASSGGTVQERPEVPDYYVQATDEDFVWVTARFGEPGYWFYDGDAEYVILPDTIQDEEYTSIFSMFGTTHTTPSNVKGVAGHAPNVTDATKMFWSNHADTLEVDYLDMPNVTDMNSMFGRTKATHISFGDHFETSQVTDMSHMFAWSQVSTLDMSSFDTANVVDMSYMFFETEVTDLQFTNLDTSNVTTMEGMFYNSQMEALDLTRFDTSNVVDMSWMFYAAKATDLDFSSFDTSNVDTMYYMFGEYIADSLDLSSFDTSNMTELGGMFYAAELDTLDLSHFDTSNVLDMGWMFFMATIPDLDLSGFDTSNVTAMRWAFRGLETDSLDLSSFDTSNLTAMDYLFQDLKTNELNVSSFDTSNVNTTAFMFYGADVPVLDLSSFDMSNASVGAMFRNVQFDSGYARTQRDADKYNDASITNIPEGLIFTVN